MNRTCVWAGIGLGLLLCSAPRVQAGGFGYFGAMGGAFGNHGGAQFGFGGGVAAEGFGNPTGGFGFGSGFGNPGGMGLTGASGFCGFAGASGFGGCCGGNFSGFPCNFGYFGGFGAVPQQSYGAWNKFPGKTFYHRDLYVANPFAFQSLTVIHYPDRPNYFYFYDPAQKKYVGRYRRGAKDQECFAPLPPNFRKATLGELAEKSYSKWGPMPALAQLTGPAVTNPSVPTPALGAPPHLIRPPDTLPGHDLPPDEFLEKEK